MKRISIDTGVEEFEINGGEENGGGVLRFNPADPNIYNRFYAAMDELNRLDAEANAKATDLEKQDLSENEKAAALLSALAEYDRKIKTLLGDIFGPSNDIDRAVGGVNLAAVANNGERVVTNLLSALEPIISAGAKAGMNTKAEAAVQKAAQNRSQRRAAKR